MDTAFSAEESFPASADGRCREGRVLKGVVLFPYFQFHCSACKSTEYILDMLSCNVLIAHSVGDLEGEIRIFVEAEPGFCLAFRIVPDGGIFFGVFSHGLQLAEVGGYGLVLYDIYLPQAVYYRAVAASIVVVEPQDTLASGVMPTMLKSCSCRWRAG